MDDFNENQNNKNYIINKLFKLKDYNEEFLRSRSLDKLEKLLSSKKIADLNDKRNSIIEELIIDDKYNFDNLDKLNLKELCSLKNTQKMKMEYIEYISKITNIDIETINKWDNEKINIKYIKLKDEEEKKSVLTTLRNFGDGISLISTPLYILKQRSKYLEQNGSTIHNNKRLEITEKFSKILRKNNNSVQYKRIMTMDILTLHDKYKKFKNEIQKDKLIDYLVEHGNYTKNNLKNKKIYILEYLKRDLQPTRVGSRQELIKILSSKNYRSRNTLKNWNINKLKKAYSEYVRDNYSPLSEYIPPNRPLTKKEKDNYDFEPKHPRLEKSRIEYLEDLYNLFIYN